MPNEIINNKLKDLPSNSGVYIMLDEFMQILYVGKAKNLKNRVKQYFLNSGNKTEKTLLLVSKIADFRYIITKNEIDALVLENNLIKEHKPYYNILLKDDKSYPYLKISTKDDFPKLEVTRRLKADGAKYFGPYMLGISTKDLLELISRAFPLRTCNLKIAKKECLNYHIGRCLAPCTKRVTKEEYKEVVKKVVEFLGGNDKEVTKNIKEKLESAAAALEFELAKEYRDSLYLLEKIVRKQISYLPRDIDLDIFSYATNGVSSTINIMIVRGGKTLGAENIMVIENGQDDDMLSSFIMQHYQKNPILVNEIIVNKDLTFSAELGNYLTTIKGSIVNVYMPILGIKKQLSDMSYANASDYLEKEYKRAEIKENMTLGAVKQLKSYLGLTELPLRMECYDISNISGVDKVSSMVVFINGEKASSMYRRFKIRTVEGIDDFKSMRETLLRRLDELKKSDVSFSDRPNLIVIDGGKGQLSSVADIIAEYNLNVISLAKREEEVFVPNNSQPIIIPKDSLALKLLQRIRDEAHRFAVTFHRQLRSKRQTASQFLEIPGIGKKMANNLMMHFKNMAKVKEATIEELQLVEGIGKNKAQDIYNYFRESK